MPSTRCCRTCPRCHDCPVVLAARARAGGRSTTSVASLVDEVFAGLPGRTLPDAVTRTLETLDAARRRPVLAGSA